MELLRITRQIHCKAVEQRATLIHRQYNRDWGTSYFRPPIDPYLTSPLLQNPGGATGREPYTTAAEVDWTTATLFCASATAGMSSDGMVRRLMMSGNSVTITTIMMMMMMMATCYETVADRDIHTAAHRHRTEVISLCTVSLACVSPKSKHWSSYVSHNRSGLWRLRSFSAMVVIYFTAGFLFQCTISLCHGNFPCLSVCLSVCKIIASKRLVMHVIPFWFWFT